MPYKTLSLLSIIFLFQFNAPIAAPDDKPNVEAVLKETLDCLKHNDLERFMQALVSLDEFKHLVKPILKPEQQKEVRKLLRGESMKYSYCRLAVEQYLRIREDGEDAGLVWRNLRYLEMKIKDVETSSTSIGNIPTTEYYLHAAARDTVFGKTYVMNIKIDMVPGNLFAGIIIDNVAEAPDIATYLENKEKGSNAEGITPFDFELDTTASVKVINLDDESQSNRSYFNVVYAGVIGNDSTLLTLEYKREFETNLTQEMYYCSTSGSDTTYLNVVYSLDLRYYHYYTIDPTTEWVFSKDSALVRGFLISDECHVLQELNFKRVK